MEKVRRLSTESPPLQAVAANAPLKSDVHVESDDPLNCSGPFKENCPLNGILEPTDPSPLNGLLKSNSLHVLNSDGP